MTVCIPSSLLIFKAVAFGILIILNLCLNSLTLVVLLRMRELKPATRVFLTSMTVADLFSLIYHIPIFISTIMNKWPFGDIECNIFSLTGLVVNVLYYINLPVVNIERYIAVEWPFRYPSLATFKRSRMVVAGVWAFALVSTTVSYIILPNKQYAQVYNVCLMTRDVEAATLETTFFLVISLTPVTLSLILFLRLYIISRAHVRRLAVQNKNATWNNNKLAMERKTFITFFIMTTCVTFCMVPNVVSNTYRNINGDDINYWFVCFAQLLYLTNTIINVIVYYWRTVAF